MAILPLLLLATTTAQAPASTPPAAPPPPPFARRGGGRLFISPMGEPFRPDSRDVSGLAMWFQQADRNHDGQLTLEEMQADADRFFAMLDVNHDGEIDPDEIDRYETVVAPEISGGPRFEMAGMGGPPPGDGPGSGEGGGGHWGHGGGGHHRGGGGGGHSPRITDDQHQGAGRYGLLELPEPVTAADTNFNRGVSREEFKEAAGQRFLALDLDHKGFLTLSGLEKIRPAPAAQPNRNVTPGEPPSDDSPPPGPVNY